MPPRPPWRRPHRRGPGRRGGWHTRSPSPWSRTMKKKLLAALLMSTALLATACGDDEEENPDVEGCEHLQEGPATAVTATATSENAPAIRADHRRYDVTLVAGNGGNSG